MARESRISVSPGAQTQNSLPPWTTILTQGPESGGRATGLSHNFESGLQSSSGDRAEPRQGQTAQIKNKTLNKPVAPDICVEYKALPPFLVQNIRKSPCVKIKLCAELVFYITK